MNDSRIAAEGRSAYARHDWETARNRFCAAGALDIDDLAMLASSCWWLGLVDESVALNSDAHRRLLDDGRTEDAAAIALEIGFSEVLRGNLDEGAGWIGRARRLFDTVPEAPARGLLTAIDADLAIQGGDLETAEALTAQVLDLGDRHGDPTLQAHGLFLSGVIALHRGRAEEARSRLDEAMLPVRSGRVVPEWAGNLYCRMMQLCHELGDVPRARSWTRLTEEWCHGYLPAVIFSGVCRVHRVQILQVDGEWDRAAVEARRAAEDLVEFDTLPAGEAHYRLGEVCRLRGRLDEAEAAYRRAHELGRDPLPGLALLHLYRGETRVAASILEAALASARGPMDRAALLAARVEVAVADVDLDAGTRLAAELGEIAEAYGSPGWRAESDQWRGAVLVARGEYAAAVPFLRGARGGWQHIGAPYEVARVRLLLAEAAAGLGDPMTARRERAVAVEALEGLGAVRELERLGSSPRGHHGGLLTTRELEVLARIAEGGSNRDAAERLHISARTVARHLANVYVKTGVSSRTGAVSWARQRGLL